jgi:hypothetical protein
MHPTCLQMKLLWSGALGFEVELFVSFQRDVWCRADLIWRWDNREIEKLMWSTRVILALSMTRETWAAGAAFSCIN